MKIRYSLRIYFFASVLLLSSVMVLGFSALTSNFFIDGLDTALTGTMRELANIEGVRDAQPLAIIGFKVASRWEDLPDSVTTRFTPPTELGVLYKTKDTSSLFELPKNLYFVAKYTNQKGETRYISRVLTEEDLAKKENAEQPEYRLLWVAMISLCALGLFALFLLLLMKKVAKPIESLGKWAKNLQVENFHHTPPNFTYNELNTLALLIRDSLRSTHATIEREQEFLNFASHELRTPISVIRSNIELLNRLVEKSPLNEKQQTTIKRIERAGQTMSELTNTLLALSRNENLENTPEPISIQETTRRLCKELDYLLDGKDVSVILEFESEDESIFVDATALHIVLTNLIRNAYQHTQAGEIKIAQRGTLVSIDNRNDIQKETLESKRINKPDNFGYGLGLKLCEKIIERQGWDYSVNYDQDTYSVAIDFNSQA